MLQPTLAASTALPAGPLPPGFLVEGQYARKANAQWYRGMVLRCCNAVELGTDGGKSFSYDVYFEDGDVSLTLSEAHLRPRSLSMQEFVVGIDQQGHLYAALRAVFKHAVTDAHTKRHVELARATSASALKNRCRSTLSGSVVCVAASVCAGGLCVWVEGERDGATSLGGIGGFEAAPRSTCVFLGGGCKLGALDGELNAVSGGWSCFASPPDSTPILSRGYFSDLPCLLPNWASYVFECNGLASNVPFLIQDAAVYGCWLHPAQVMAVCNAASALLSSKECTALLPLAGTWSKLSGLPPDGEVGKGGDTRLNLCVSVESWVEHLQQPPTTIQERHWELLEATSAQPPDAEAASAAPDAKVAQVGKNDASLAEARADDTDAVYKRCAARLAAYEVEAECEEACGVLLEEVCDGINNSSGSGSAALPPALASALRRLRGVATGKTNGCAICSCDCTSTSICAIHATATPRALVSAPPPAPVTDAEALAILLAPGALVFVDTYGCRLPAIVISFSAAGGGSTSSTSPAVVVVSAAAAARPNMAPSPLNLPHFSPAGLSISSAATVRLFLLPCDDARSLGGTQVSADVRDVYFPAAACEGASCPGENGSPRTAPGTVTLSAPSSPLRSALPPPPPPPHFSSLVGTVRLVSGEPTNSPHPALPSPSPPHTPLRSPPRTPLRTPPCTPPRTPRTPSAALQSSLLLGTPRRPQEPQQLQWLPAAQVASQLVHSGIMPPVVEPRRHLPLRCAALHWLLKGGGGRGNSSGSGQSIVRGNFVQLWDALCSAALQRGADEVTGGVLCSSIGALSMTLPSWRLLHAGRDACATLMRLSPKGAAGEDALGLLLRMALGALSHCMKGMEVDGSRNDSAPLLPAQEQQLRRKKNRTLLLYAGAAMAMSSAHSYTELTQAAAPLASFAVLVLGNLLNPSLEAATLSPLLHAASAVLASPLGAVGLAATRGLSPMLSEAVARLAALAQRVDETAPLYLPLPAAAAVSEAAASCLVTRTKLARNSPLTELPTRLFTALADARALPLSGAPGTVAWPPQLPVALLHGGDSPLDAPTVLGGALCYRLAGAKDRGASAGRGKEGGRAVLQGALSARLRAPRFVREVAAALPALQAAAAAPLALPRCEAQQLLGELVGAMRCWLECINDTSGDCSTWSEALDGVLAQALEAACTASTGESNRVGGAAPLPIAEEGRIEEAEFEADAELPQTDEASTLSSPPSPKALRAPLLAALLAAPPPPHLLPHLLRIWPRLVASFTSIAGASSMLGSHLKVGLSADDFSRRLAQRCGELLRLLAALTAALPLLPLEPSAQTPPSRSTHPRHFSDALLTQPFAAALLPCVRAAALRAAVEVSTLLRPAGGRSALQPPLQSRRPPPPLLLSFLPRTLQQLLREVAVLRGIELPPTAADMAPSISAVPQHLSTRSASLLSAIMDGTLMGEPFVADTFEQEGDSDDGESAERGGAESVMGPSWGIVGGGSGGPHSMRDEDEADERPSLSSHHAAHLDLAFRALGVLPHATLSDSANRAFGVPPPLINIAPPLNSFASGLIGAQTAVLEFEQDAAVGSSMGRIEALGRSSALAPQLLRSAGAFTGHRLRHPARDMGSRDTVHALAENVMLSVHGPSDIFQSEPLRARDPPMHGFTPAMENAALLQGFSVQELNEAWAFLRSGGDGAPSRAPGAQEEDHLGGLLLGDLMRRWEEGVEVRGAGRRRQEPVHRSLAGPLLRLRLSRWPRPATPPAAATASSSAAAVAPTAPPPPPLLLPQLQSALAHAPAGALRVRGRPWWTQFEGEGGMDAGGLFAECLTSVWEEVGEGRAGVGCLPLAVPVRSGEGEVAPSARLLAWRQGGGGLQCPAGPARGAAAAHAWVVLGRLLGVGLRCGHAAPIALPPALWEQTLGCGEGRVDFGDTALAPAAVAFAAGLGSVLPISLLRLAGPAQLQASAAGSQRLNVTQLRATARLIGWHSARHPTVLAFWEVLEGMTAEEQELVMRFVFARRRLPAGGGGGGNHARASSKG